MDSHFSRTHGAALRSDVEAPPPYAVEWEVSCGTRSERVSHQLWMSARAEGAARLGVMPEACKCVRVDEMKLTGKGLA